MKKWLTYFALIAVSLTACTNQQQPPVIVKLKGRMFKCNYGADVYKIEFLSDSLLKWTGIAGMQKGKVETSYFRQTTISADSVQLSWAPDSLTKIDQQLNFKNNTVNTSIINKKESVLMKGKLTESRRF
jgi:hypothetical protein